MYAIWPTALGRDKERDGSHNHPNGALQALRELLSKRMLYINGPHIEPLEAKPADWRTGRGTITSLF